MTNLQTDMQPSRYTLKCSSAHIIARHFRWNVEVSRRQRQFFREERDGALDSTVITLQQHGADRDIRGVCVDDNWLLEFGMRDSGGCTKSTFDFSK